MRERWYRDEEEKRLCTLCGGKVETWEHIWENCRGWEEGGESWQEAMRWVLRENGKREEWMRKVDNERKRWEREKIDNEEEESREGVGKGERERERVRERERFWRKKRWKRKQKSPLAACVCRRLVLAGTESR